MRSLPFVERSELAGWGAVWTVVFIIATVVSFLGGAARDNGLPADRGGEPLFASTGKIGAAERPAAKKFGGRRCVRGLACAGVDGVDVWHISGLRVTVAILPLMGGIRQIHQFLD